MKIYSPTFKGLLAPGYASFAAGSSIQPHGITTINSRDFCSLDYFNFNKWNGDTEWDPFYFKTSITGQYVFGIEFTNWFRVTNNYSDPTKGLFHFFGSWQIITNSSRFFSMSFTPPNSVGSLIYTGSNDDIVANITTNFNRITSYGLKTTITNTSPPSILVGVTSIASSEPLTLNINGVAKINMYS